MPVYKVLVYTDTHGRDNDFETIKGFVRANRLMFKDLNNFIVDMGITHAISAGDLMDKGYGSTMATINDTRRISSMTEALKGNHYLVRGNHFFHERDSNPEMGFIQPHPTITPREPVDIDKPLLKSPDYFVLGNVQFSLFHWNEDGTGFIQEKQPGVKYHIGIYHHENMVPTSVRKKVGVTTVVGDGYLKDTLRNVSFAVCGHVHGVGGLNYVEVDGRKVPVMVPGSLALTSTHMGEYHTHVELPVFIVDTEKGTLTYKTYKFSLHTECLRMYRDKKLDLDGVDVNEKHIREKRELNSKNKIERKNIDTGLRAGATLDDYLSSCNYNEREKALINTMINRPLKIMEAVRLGVEENDL